MLMKMNARMWRVRVNHALMISDRIAISRLLTASNIRYAISTKPSITETERTVWATNRNAKIERDRIATIDPQNEVDISEIEFADKYAWKNTGFLVRIHCESKYGASIKRPSIWNIRARHQWAIIQCMPQNSWHAYDVREVVSPIDMYERDW
jgi:hypothetical protein